MRPRSKPRKSRLKLLEEKIKSPRTQKKIARTVISEGIVAYGASKGVPPMLSQPVAKKVSEKIVK